MNYNYTRGTEFRSVEQDDQTMLLSEVMLHGYHLKGRQVPERIDDLVDSLRDMVLKYMPDVTIGTIREASERYILNEETPGLSVAVFFKAIRSGYIPSRRERSFDSEEPARRDDEMDTICLLDILMGNVAAGRPAYADWKREYSYLVMRSQIAARSWEAHLEEAKAKVNAARVKDFRRPVEVWEGEELSTLEGKAKELAVRKWLVWCHESGRTPSDILVPMLNSVQYDEWREQQ